MEALAGVAVGSLLAGFLQWWLTPHVQRRIRSDERVEAALEELLALIGDDVPAAMRKLDLAKSSSAFLDQLIEERRLDEEDHRLVAMRRDDDERVADAMSALQSARVRYWGTIRRARLRRNPIVLKHYTAVHAMPPWATTVSSLKDNAEDALWTQEQQSRRDALTAVEERYYRDEIPLPTRLHKRVGRWRSRAGRLLGRLRHRAGGG